MLGRSLAPPTLLRTSSHESLTAHPLLSPSPSPSSSTTAVAAGDTHTHAAAAAAAIPPAASAPPRYVPYTPRQRTSAAITTQSATTSTTTTPATSTQPHGPDATSRLQLMHLKAAAQKGGLDAASTGWAILERLGTETDHGPEWNRIWEAIVVGKVCKHSLFFIVLGCCNELGCPLSPIVLRCMCRRRCYCRSRRIAQTSRLHQRSSRIMSSIGTAQIARRRWSHSPGCGGQWQSM
jgi:hypothetical protein